MTSKRYTILNKHINGGSVLPQSNHALNNLWKKLAAKEMTSNAEKKFMAWAQESEIEVVLKGGRHIDLENLYEQLCKMEDVPAAKFNESMEDLMGTCTSVTFVATDRIVALNNYVRMNAAHFTYHNAYEQILKLSNKQLGSMFDTPVTENEAYVVAQIAYMQPMVL